MAVALGQEGWKSAPQRLPMSAVTFLTHQQPGVWRWLGRDVPVEEGKRQRAPEGRQQRMFSASGLLSLLPYLQAGSQILQMHREQTST